MNDFTLQDRINSLSEYSIAYEKSVKDPEGFWSGIAENFQWKQKWNKVLEWDFEKPDVKWFLNGKLNITENILDRHLEERGDQVAILWEPNDPNEKHQSITFRQLHSKVCQFANAMKNHGVEKGDRVIIYMPMVPEATIAMLACARIGAVHSVVFAGFSASALADRITDCHAKMILTSDGNFRGAKTTEVKSVVDEAVEKTDCVESVIVLE